MTNKSYVHPTLRSIPSSYAADWKSTSCRGSFQLKSQGKTSLYAYPAPGNPALGSIAPAPELAPACPGWFARGCWGANRCSKPVRKPLISSSYPVSDSWSSWNASTSRRKRLRFATRVCDASGSFVLRERARYAATRVDAPPRVEIATEV